jgi:fatty-acyl-CoA synthase
MGLVGFSLAPLFGQCGVDYLPPSAFARRPVLWLRLMAANASTITYAPGFGYRLAAQRFARQAEALDLSRLRIAGIGGDMIRAEVLDHFAETLAPAGFRPEAFLPSYGMAETTLAASFAPLGRSYVTHAGADGRGHIMCGYPLPNHELLVVDATGTALPDGGIGHIWLRGPSLMTGYFDDPDATARAMRRDGFLDTGDLGYLHDGQIVVTGRAKDVILLRGRNVWPDDVEWAAERAAGLSPGEVVAFGIEEEREDVLVALVQCGLTGMPARNALQANIQVAIGAALGVTARIVLVPPRRLPVTSSGKLARGEARTRYLAGAYTAAPFVDAQPS